VWHRRRRGAWVKASTWCSATRCDCLGRCLPAPGVDEALAVLAGIDEYYVDRSEEPGSVLTALVVALAEPRPGEADVIDELPRYKRLARRWHDWSEVVAVCEELALRLSGAA
jgi:hypothetical protein